MRHGAIPLGDGRARFGAWAPHADEILLALEGREPLVMDAVEDGWYEVVATAPHGSRYRYIIDGAQAPDPASRWQPDGVDGASAVVDLPTPTRWQAPPLRDWVLYELHVGTFTAEGTFDAAVSHLPELAALGVTAIELMPLAAFPGERNWGYDGVFPFAVQQSYGGPESFVRFVDAAHAAGLAVVVDVVYNHTGPEGSVLHRFGPYFTDRHTTPWGNAMNFSSDGVRQYVRENAAMWLESYGTDALRLDAIQAIVDTSDTHIITEIARDHPGKILIAEGEQADSVPDGVDIVWADDLHHALHAALTGERHGYYARFGRPEDVAAAYGCEGIVCIQNHDQVGNRAFGERIITLAGSDKARLAAAAILLAPGVPMIFMGEEYGETAPFLYFVDHADEALRASVRDGRRTEFGIADAPDPSDPETFARSKLTRSGALEPLYRELIRLRRVVDRSSATTSVQGDLVSISFGRSTLSLNLSDAELPAPTARRTLDTADAKWGGNGSKPGMLAPWSAVLWEV